MEPVYVWSLLAVIIVILSASCFFLGRSLISHRHKLKDFQKLKNQSILDDLELATSDQLLNELRTRKGKPFLMLSPMQGEDFSALSIEIHGIEPVSCFQMLQLATALTFQELRKRGVEIPDFNPGSNLGNEGEEWKQ